VRGILHNLSYPRRALFHVMSVHLYLRIVGHQMRSCG
jgi:hypothetical protein